MRTDNCMECGKALSRRKDRKTNYCRHHLPAQPAERARRAAAVTAKHADPTWAARRAVSLKAARARAAIENPELMQRYADSLREHRINPSVAGSAERQRAAAKGRATQLAHIPLEYRDEYVALSAARLSAPERVRIITEQIERDTERFRTTGELQRTKEKTR